MASPDTRLEVIRCADLAEQERLLAELLPDQPVLEYLPARAKSLARPHTPLVFALRSGRAIVAAAAGILRPARGRPSLVLAPGPDAPAELWDRLRSFARDERVGRVVAERAGAAPLPAVPGEANRSSTTTYMLELSGLDVHAALSRNHRRNLKRAERAGIAIVVCSRGEALQAHVRLRDASLSRRSRRGERVVDKADVRTAEAFLETGCAELVQAGRDDEVLSSDLVVRVGDTGYYLGGGTSPEGMRHGAAHLLMVEVVRRLQASGCRLLNLGYTDTQDLGRFKSGFGARPVPVEIVEAHWGSSLDRLTRALAARFKRWTASRRLRGS